MNDLVEKYLKPISAEQPCGPDLSYDPKMDELASTLQGKPEVEIGSVVRPAEPPDWRLLREQTEEFLGRTKHLRPAVVLCCTWLKMDGIAGFRDGLVLIRGLLEQYWANLYPLLDPEDNNDPTQRLNILRSITAPRGSVTGWLTFADYLQEAPLTDGKGAPPVTYAQLQAARNREAGGATEGAEGPTTAGLAGALRSAGGEQAAARYEILQGALEAVKGIDQFLTSTLGAGESISFEVAEGVLQEIMAVLKPYLPGGGTDAAPSDAAAGGAENGSGLAGIQISGAIRSRDDVTRTIDAICEYYRQIEPGSPVPFLLRRAQMLAAMNFVQAVQELNLATVDALRPSMGSALEAGETPAASSPPAS